jgi:hypothetical protein
MKPLFGVMVVVMIYTGTVLGVEVYKGAESMVLQGGRFGDVPFAHVKHHLAVEDCNACHNLFPKQKGSIDQLKASGQLRSQEVMGQCTSCHLTKDRKGKKSGPTSCSGCHSG